MNKTILGALCLLILSLIIIGCGNPTDDSALLQKMEQKKRIEADLNKSFERHNQQLIDENSTGN